MSSGEKFASRRPRSRTDLVELAVYIANESIDAAERLLDAAEETFTFLPAIPKQVRSIQSRIHDSLD